MTAAVGAFTRQYVVRPPRLAVELPTARRSRASQRSSRTPTPYTYFESRPIELAEGVALDSGTLAGVVLRRASLLDMPTVTWRALSPRARIVKHRRVESFAGAGAITMRSLDDRPLPLQVDGDYLGEVPEIAAHVEPAALHVVS